MEIVFVIIIFIWLFSLSSRIKKLEQQHELTPVESAAVSRKNKEDQTSLKHSVKKQVATVKKGLDGQSLEEKIGQQWFQWLGIGALVIALLFFLRWSFENGIIGPVGRTVLGYAFSAGAIFAGDRLRNRYGAWSLAFTGGGALGVYIVTWIGLNVYELFPASMAMLLYILTTLIVGLLAGYYNAKPLALFGIIGGLLTPLLVGEGGNSIALLGYVFILNIGVLALAYARNWRDLHIISLFGTLLWELFVLVDGDISASSGILFALLFFAVYLFVSCLYNLVQQKESVITDSAILVINSLAHFGFILWWLDEAELVSQFNAIVSLLFAIIFLVFSVNVYKYNKKDTPLVYTSLALTVWFVSLAIPLQFGDQWVPLVWSIEAVFLLLLSLYVQDYRIQRFAWPVMIAAYVWYLVPLSGSNPLAVGAFGFGIFLLWVVLFVSLIWQALLTPHKKEYQLLPFALVGLIVLTYSVGVNFFYGVLPDFTERLVQAVALIGGGYVALWQAGKQWEQLNESEQNSFKGLALAVQIISVCYLSFEFSEYIRATYQTTDMRLGRQITQVGLSIIWAAYAAGALLIGFKKSLKPLRLFGMGLLLIAIAKLTLVDLFSLGTGYRVIGFTILGGLLTAASFLYQHNKKAFQDLLQ